MWAKQTKQHEGKHTTVYALTEYRVACFGLLTDTGRWRLLCTVSLCLLRCVLCIASTRPRATDKRQVRKRSKGVLGRIIVSALVNAIIALMKIFRARWFP